MTPHELAARYLLPALKGLTAVSLKERGVGQTTISKLLSVSQPMVSKYLRRTRSQYYEELTKMGLTREEIKNIEDELVYVALKHGKAKFLEVLTGTVNSILRRGLLCSFHRRLEPELDPNCRMCMELFNYAVDVYVSRVERALVELVEGTLRPELIPEVGSNIVCAPPRASTISDVIGLTGRIVKSCRTIVATGKLMYGGSKHTAQVLLTVMNKWGWLRCALVLRYSEEVLGSARRLGLHVVFSGPHEGAEELVEDLRKMLDLLSRAPDVIADQGGVGLEPVIYVFARSPEELVSKVKAITCSVLDTL